MQQNLKVLFYILILSFCFLITENLSVSAISMDSSCKNVETIFARGSGAQIGKNESEKYLRSFNSRFENSIVTYNSYELGTESYGNQKYQAVNVSEWANGNAVGAKVSSGYANDYGKSVDSGVGELYNYLVQRNDKCKSAGTKFVLAGYSQGAQVIGQTLPKFTAELRKNIIFSAFFGDPKLHLPEGEGFNPPACRGKDLSAYRRYIANCDVDNGSLGARKPYLPDDMKSKSGLWCYDHDYVCGVTHNFKDNAGHAEYAADGKAIDSATAEIAARAKEVLPATQVSTINTKPTTTASGTPDVVYIIDTTGSMGGRIEQTKTFIREASAKIKSLNGRVALVAYKDAGDEYTAKVVSDFTTNLDDFSTKLATLTASGGGDYPEATLHALMTSFNQLNWKNGATKAAVVLTDAEFHNPDTVDGSTIASVAKRSLEIDPVNVYSVVPSYIETSYRELSEQTSGQVIVDNGDTVGALTTALTKIQQRPVVSLKNTLYRADTGQEITFDASDTYVVDSAITKYEWDFNGDGIFDQTTTTPIVNYTYSQKFDGNMQVRVSAANNTIGSFSATVKIGTYVLPVLPQSPSNLIATVTSTKDSMSTVNLTWKSTSTTPAYWVVTSNGVALGKVTGMQTSLEISDVSRGSDVEFGVSAMSNDGTQGDAALTTVKSVSTTAVETPMSWWEFILACIRKLLACWGLIVGW